MATAAVAIVMHPGGAEVTLVEYATRVLAHLLGLGLLALVGYATVAALDAVRSARAVGTDGEDVEG